MERQTRLRVLRAQHNLTQEQTADAAGVSRPTYANVEAGNFRGSVDLWRRLQKVFNLSDAETWRLINDANAEENRPEDDANAID